MCDVVKRQIISYIKNNRVSTTEVADAMGKKGHIPGIMPANKGHFRVGKVFYAYAHSESNWDAHEQIQNAQAGDVVFIDAFNCAQRSIIGDIVSKYLLLYKRAEAIIVNGSVRDAHRIIKENWPIWCSGFSPIGCFNRKVTADIDLIRKIEEKRGEYENSIAICDDAGVVIIPKNLVSETMLEKLHFIEAQEDIWYECLDRQKMSTYEIICLKKYLKGDNEV